MRRSIFYISLLVVCISSMGYPFMFLDYFDLCFLSSTYWFIGILCLLWILLWIHLFIVACTLIYYGLYTCCKYASPSFSCMLKLCGIFSTLLLTCVSLKVMLLIDIELAYMNTNHEDFIGFAKWVLPGQRRWHLVWLCVYVCVCRTQACWVKPLGLVPAEL